MGPKKLNKPKELPKFLKDRNLRTQEAQKTPNRHFKETHTQAPHDETTKKQRERGNLED